MSTPDDARWRDLAKTAVEFERRFATEEDCRAYWIEGRWGGTLFECADCGHQTSLTSCTLLEKAKKPFKVRFRAIFEISARPERHLGQGAEADHGVRLLQDGVGLAAQTSRSYGAVRQLAARPFCRDGRDPGRGKGKLQQGAGAGRGGKKRSRASRSRRLQRQQPRGAFVRAARAEQTGAARERRGSALPLDGVESEALASRYAWRRGEAERPAGLPRRVRVSLEPAQDERRWAHRGAYHREPRLTPGKNPRRDHREIRALHGFPELRG